MDPMVTAAAVGVGGQLLNNFFNLGIGNQYSKADKEFAMNMMDRQNDYNIQNWMRVNRYNLPSALRQRLEDAGLNPLLLYGQGGAVQNAAASIGSPTSHNHQSQVPRMDAVGTQLGLMLAQIQQLQAQSKKEVAEAHAAEASASKSEAETDTITLENAWNRSTFQLRIDKLTAEKKLSDELAKTEFEKQKEIQAEANRLETEVDYINNKIANENRLTDAEVREINQRIDNSIKELAKKLSLYDAEARKAIAEAYLAEVTAKIKKETEGSPEWQAVQLEKLRAETVKAIEEGDALQIENSLKQWKLDMLPHKGKSLMDNNGYYWAKFISFSLGPIGGILSSAVSGLGAAAAK